MKNKLYKGSALALSALMVAGGIPQANKLLAPTVSYAAEVTDAEKETQKRELLKEKYDALKKYLTESEDDFSVKNEVVGNRALTQEERDRVVALVKRIEEEALNETNDALLEDLSIEKVKELNSAIELLNVELLLDDSNLTEEEKLERNKERVLKEIEQLKELTEEEKAEIRTTVEKASTQEELETIVEETYSTVEKVQEQNLVLAKAEAYAEIGKLENINETKAQEYLDEVSKLQTLNEVEKLLEDARAFDKSIAELEDVKTQAKAIIDSNLEANNITSEQAEEFKSRIDEAQDKDSINVILDEVAQVYRNDVLAELKQNANDEIDKALEEERIDEAKAAELKGRVEEATDKDTIDEILAGIPSIEEETPEEDLEAVKEKAIKEIEELPLTETVNQSYKDNAIQRVKDAETVKEVEDILKEVKEASVDKPVDGGETEDTLAAYKESAIEKINALEKLPEDVKSEFVAEVEKATSEKEVDDVVAKAEAWEAPSDDEDKALEEAKVAAKSTIDSLEYLKDERKASYKTKIDLAKTVKEVEDIVKKAETANKNYGPEGLNFDKLTQSIIDGSIAIGVKEKGTSEQREQLREYLAQATIYQLAETEDVTQEKVDDLAQKISTLVSEMKISSAKNNDKGNVDTGKQTGNGNGNVVTTTQTNQVAVNKSELIKAITDADSILKDVNKGTTEQRDKLTAALNEARLVRDDSKATQQQVDDATKKLKEVIDEINGKTTQNAQASQNAKTGIAGIAGISGVLASATAAYAVNKRK